ncbi:MAG: type VI secretion system baseplate subunit TssG [Thiolinea sp.]
MASENRNSADTLRLFEEIIADAPRWGYYAALRQFECLYADQPRLGESRRPSDDKIRLGQEPSTIFAPATLHAANRNDELLHLSVLFMGVFGPNGPLPLHLTEYARNRIRDVKDESMVKFMDMFHHRLLSLFYRVWANKEPTVHYDRPESDRFHCYVGSLLGIGVPELWERDGLSDNSKLHFAGHFGALPHHAEGLSSILRSFFKVPLKIQEFVGEWLKIPDESLCKLGSHSGALGVDTVLGGYSWQCQYKFRLLIGPMPLQDYKQLLPGGEKLALVSDILKNYLGYELACDARLILDKKEVPGVSLGQSGQLGWTTWLNNQPADSDADDLLLNIRI